MIVLERPTWNLETILELVEPGDDIKVGSTFRWSAINGRVRIRTIAPSFIRPTRPGNVCVVVDLVDALSKREGGSRDEGSTRSDRRSPPVKTGPF